MKRIPSPVEIPGEVLKGLYKRLRVVGIAGFVEPCRMGLTYGRSMISAMLDDVWSDVGNVGNVG